MQDAAIVKPRQNENKVQCVILEIDLVVRIEQLALRAITRLGLILEQCHALPLVAVPMAVAVDDLIEE